MVLIMPVFGHCLTEFNLEINQGRYGMSMKSGQTLDSNTPKKNCGYSMLALC